MKKLALLALLATSGSALAHVTLETPTAASGGYYKGVLKIGHGCNGSPTTAISVEMPEGVRLAQPMPKAGWEVEVSKSAVKPFDNYGRKVSEDVSRITWKGGKLPSNFYDEFVFQAKIATQPGKLYFKVKQQCEQGETNWAEIPAAGQDAHELKSPAAELTVTAAGAAGHHH
ncbi:YcnI family copper-binding membrane protein [Chromobacterium haemolyticum]|uniref:YcnI family copper-binding membrane protein n=1 Tax=Chromobacterium haemolyticum TaxID=394935 RepID=UPI0009D9C31B|nr:YcnI family protein [Chromobacterium haemolyticum]OQS34393.1 nuclear export factor GLE1 [Chromobacterium haemolyticum]